MSIYEAAERYQAEGVPLIVLAGKEYGTGSSRDWAAKGTVLLGVRAVIAKSFERIHRSNLVGMGVLPLQFEPGEDAASLGLTGAETYDDRRHRRGPGAGQAADRARDGGRRRAKTFTVDLPHRHAGGGRLLQPRRHPAVRAAAAAAQLRTENQEPKYPVP